MSIPSRSLEIEDLRRAIMSASLSVSDFQSISSPVRAVVHRTDSENDISA